MKCDGDLCCCECDCTTGGGSNEAKPENYKNMVCVHICPVIIKITALLCDFSDDRICYELVAHLTIKYVFDKYDTNDVESMTESIITLAAVAMTSRGDVFPKSLPSLILIETLKCHFNVGTEKAKASTIHSGLCPLEHVLLTKIKYKSIINLGKQMWKYQDSRHHNVGLEHKRNVFVPNYKLIALLLNKVLNVKEDATTHKHTCYKLLHRLSEGSCADEDGHDLQVHRKINGHGLLI